MAQKEIELILMRQLASYLATPVFIVDPAGNLVFYNEPAESILGRRFEETGEMPATQWATAFTPMQESGAPLPPDALPLTIALREHRLAHCHLWIRGLDNALRHIEAVAFPLVGHGEHHLGAVVIFREVGRG